MSKITAVYMSTRRARITNLVFVTFWRADGRTHNHEHISKGSLARLQRAAKRTDNEIIVEVVSKGEGETVGVYMRPKNE